MRAAGKAFNQMLEAAGAGIQSMPSSENYLSANAEDSTLYLSSFGQYLFYLTMKYKLELVLRVPNAFAQGNDLEKYKCFEA